MKVTPEQIKAVKAEGFLHNRGTDLFSGRIITVNGKVNHVALTTLAEAAKKFGNGSLLFTTRLTIEIPGIHYDNIPAFQEFIAQEGCVTGGTGAKVRPVVSCKGTTCQYGQADTLAVSEKIHHLFYEGYRNVSLPHKFKIAVGGCPNNCVKPNLNDVGVIGLNRPQFDVDKCKGCKKCTVLEACPIHAVSRIEGDADNRIAIDQTCNHCGFCTDKCHFDAMNSHRGYRLVVGGRWGKNIAIGQFLSPFFDDEEEVMQTIEKVILFYRSMGQKGERLSQTIERIGFEKSQEMILEDQLLKDKNQILDLKVETTATC
ncbi:MAG: (4Fe-4S)-binding protein [Eubacteriaceae bacterium]|jgi:dissimilatory sulfite reductase (desulfoviridin) alpha/beta subunit|nr:(4Fe-4S)-binding protein [Eubacteriaceae bacterium]